MKINLEKELNVGDNELDHAKMEFVIEHNISEEMDCREINKKVQNVKKI